MDTILQERSYIHIDESQKYCAIKSLDTKKCIVYDSQLDEILEQAKLTSGGRNQKSELLCQGKGLIGKQLERTFWSV